jgi:acyl carrier protein
MDSLSFDQFADFVRDRSGISQGKQITLDTQFERDLGITGDDGEELLTAAEKHFGVLLSDEAGGYRQTFNLNPNEYLFNAEGSGAGFRLFKFTTLFNDYSVHTFTVGELYRAVQTRMRDKLQSNE